MFTINIFYSSIIRFRVMHRTLNE